MTPAYHIFREVLCLELHVAHAEFLNEVLAGVGRQHRRWVQASIGLTWPSNRFDRYRLVGIKDIQDLCTWGEGTDGGGLPFQQNYSAAAAHKLATGDPHCSLCSPQHPDRVHVVLTCPS